MTINTKFNIGEKVWFLDNYGKIQNTELSAIDISISKDKQIHIKYHYYLHNSGRSTLNEIQIRKTKAEVGEDWMKLNGLKK